MESGNRSSALPVLEASPLYKAIDALNRRYGKGKVFSARLGSLESRAPLARRLRRGAGRPLMEDEATKFSKRLTTRWCELMTVR